jgi:ketosteroid isomerase-like protein
MSVTSRLAALPCCLLLLASCAPSPDLAALRSQLQEADGRYTAVMDAGDVGGIVSLYATDATRYPPDGEPAGGPEAIRAFAERVSAMAGFHLTASPVTMDVARGGDMGYTLNLLELTFAGPDGAPTAEHLRDFHIWRREADGAWRIVEDIWQVLPEPDAPQGTR